MRIKLDILLVKTFPCDHDARINKMLYHLEKIDLKIGVLCVSRNRACTRIQGTNLYHESVLGFNHNFGKNRFLVTYFKVLTELVVTSVKIARLISRRFKTKAIMGVDFDGYLITFMSFPFVKTRKIFEVSDPWSTMVNSFLISKIEHNFFTNADFLIMPAEDSRIKVNRKNCISLGNELLPNLAHKVIRPVQIPHEVRQFVELNDSNYILAGGNLSPTQTRITDLIRFITTQSDLTLVVVQNGFDHFDLRKIEYSNKVIFFDLKKDWAAWLYLLKHAKATWVYYNDKIEHFNSKISPNKYWESVLFQVPMLVNKTSQFVDRVPPTIEPPLLEWNWGGLSDIQALQSVCALHELLVDSQKIPLDEYFSKLEVVRDKKVNMMLQALKIV